jgi:hypothetical protein
MAVFSYRRKIRLSTGQEIYVVLEDASPRVIVSISECFGKIRIRRSATLSKEHAIAFAKALAGSSRRSVVEVDERTDLVVLREISRRDVSVVMSYREGAIEKGLSISLLQPEANRFAKALAGILGGDLGEDSDDPWEADTIPERKPH